MEHTLVRILQIALALAAMFMLVTFGAVMFLILLGLVAAFAIYQWLFGAPATIFVRRTQQEFREHADGSGDRGNSNSTITVIETEYHEVSSSNTERTKDSPPDSPAQSG